MKNAKTIIISLLIVVMAFVFVGFSAAEQAVHEPVTIAVAMATVSNEYVRMQDYLSKYLGPALNIDFIFSSQLNSTEEFVAFIENAYTAGAAGLVDLAVSNTINAETIDAKCAEYGMPYSTWSAGSYKALENRQGVLAGGIGSDMAIVQEAAYNWTKGIFTGEGDLNLVIFSVVAFMGNAQQYPAIVGFMNAIRENYGLDISDEEISAFALSDTNVTYSNGSNVNIVNMPGAPGFIGDWDTNGTVLEEGSYDKIIIAGDTYGRFMETIDRYEEMLNRDFTVYGLASINDAFYNGFNTLDRFGNPKLDSVLLKTGTAGVFATAVLLNEMYGDDDVLGDHGVFPLDYAPVYGADGYNAVGMIDTAEEYYAVTVDEFKSMIKYYTPDLDYETFYKLVPTLSSAKNIVERRGIQN